LTGHDLAEKAKMKYPTVRDIVAGISPGQMENLRAIAGALGVTLAELHQDETYDPQELNQLRSHPDHPTTEDTTALGVAFALASQGKRLLALYLLTRDESYYMRAAAIPDVLPLAKVLRKALLSS
jgi:transcriptional regulator with XRE-family HTH domain